MGTNSAWRCDGCGEERQLRHIDEWRIIQLTIKSAKGAPLVSAEYELCPGCQVHLLDAASPQNWRHTRFPHTENIVSG